MQNFADVEVINQPALETINYTAPGELVLTELGINPAALHLAEIPHWQLAHYIAIEYWLLEYKPKPNASNLEQVRGYLEAFHHLCEIEAWEQARQILFIRPIASTKELYKQLDTWGYHREQIEIYSRLLERVSTDLDCFLFNGLGRAYGYLGQPQLAINYHQRQLELARASHNRQAEASAVGGLGRIYYADLGQNKNALESYQRQLEIARYIGKRDQEVEALIGIANTCTATDEYQKSIKYLNEALAIARQLADDEMALSILESLGSKYIHLGNPKQTIKLIEPILKTSYINYNRRLKWRAIQNLGCAYLILEKYQQAIDYLEEGLILIRELGDPFGEVLTLSNLATLHTRWGNFSTAIDYYPAVLKITRQVGNRAEEAIIMSDFSYCYGCLKQYSKAIRYSKKALKIARELNSKKFQGFALASLANAHWHKGEYVYGLILITKSMLIYPPWKSESGQIILKKTLQTICKPLKAAFQKFLSFLGIKPRDKNPTNCRK